ncbi:porin [Aestuariibius insulae]|uniref:porin n=1 Tax=Aestuariibius insulae TaxID=2058287 RepID=UPI00345E71B9
MKNILLATTALFATAGFAAAEVSLSGSAEMGIFGGDTNIEGADDIPTQFHTDIDVKFTLSGSTDSGLTFGADIDLDESNDNDAFAGNTQGGESIFVSGAFGTLTMGDTDGAYDKALKEAIIGADIIDTNEHLGYNGNNGLDGEFYDGQIARYDYALSNFNFAASLELNDADDAGDPIFGLGVDYTFPLFGDEHTVGFGYQTVDSLSGVDDADDGVSIYGLSGDFNFGDFNVILNYSAADVDDGLGDFDPTHFGLAVGYTLDALTLAVNYGEYDDWVLSQNDVFLDTSGIGFIANYDLGGGLEAQFGYSRSIIDDALIDDDGDLEDAELDAYSLGLSMSF